MKEVNLIPLGNSEEELELFESIVHEIAKNPQLTADNMGVGVVTANILVAIHLNLQKRGIKLMQGN